MYYLEEKQEEACELIHLLRQDARLMLANANQE